ncbi:hypothetical protein Pla123a_46280 [Posidoniimonas polymericola]|uniref:DUF1570 domain-containing protein n=1 Tax=Posidoniimonas polymericola TaxID=2528002 RepID=A0A5C5XV37_9BACT|nr:hypothetical protein [Posidoniimonas polymericola]TWT66740.1 hypothetical protein Pla123a_46280 [Posidoniimonas polymericola]
MGKFSRRALLAAAAGCLATPRGASASSLTWVDQRQYGPFQVRSTFPLDSCSGVLQELPALELELRRVLALSPCEEPIDIEVLSSKRQHRDYLKNRFPNTPYRRALFVKLGGQATVFAYRDEELGVDLRHECTHALLHADLAMVPLWLDEGLAEYFEMPKADRAFGNPHEKLLQWDMRFGLVESLASLEAKRDLSQMNSGDYRSAWAWTHFMLHGPQAASQQLWSFLAAIRRGEPPGSLSERLEAVLPGVERQLARHFQKWTRMARQ